MSVLLRYLDAAAKESAHPELSKAPIVGWLGQNGASLCADLYRRAPERVLAWADGWYDRWPKYPDLIAQVPVAAAWEFNAKERQAERDRVLAAVDGKATPAADLRCYASTYGFGHGIYSKFNFFAAFLDRCITARLPPEPPPPGQAVPLRPADLKSGWVGDYNKVSQWNAISPFEKASGMLPPGSERYVVDGRTYAGYKDTPDSWVEGQPKKEVNWYAGKQYDDDMANAKAALENLARIYPDYKGQGYEIAGFVWWQGHKDQNPVHAGRYEQNLVRLIQTLRKDYDAPHAKFVLATIAFKGWKLAEPGLTIANAQLAVGDAKKHPEFANNVKSVEARDLWREADVSPNPKQGYHYNRNAETYMEVGLRLGQAMADLLKNP